MRFISLLPATESSSQYIMCNYVFTVSLSIYCFRRDFDSRMWHKRYDTKHQENNFNAQICVTIHVGGDVKTRSPLPGQNVIEFP